jgi:hypothetical protein
MRGARALPSVPALPWECWQKSCFINVIVSNRAGFSPLLSGSQGTEMSGSNACAATPFGRTVDIKFRPDL